MLKVRAEAVLEENRALQIHRNPLQKTLKKLTEVRKIVLEKEQVEKKRVQKIQKIERAEIEIQEEIEIDNINQEVID